MGRGGDVFFSKPLQRDEFLVRVKSLLATHQARKEEAAGRQAMEADAPETPQGFERDLPRRLMDRILATPEVNGQAPGGYQSRFNAVILFADLRGFTRMAEQLTPTQVVLLLNQYFSLLTEVTYRYEGVIFNMAGDSLLVGFGVPFEQPDAAERAIKCGHDMFSAFETLSSEWHTKYGLETGLGIGVNKGEGVAGHVGSPPYTRFTIIRDAVNIPSRLLQRARADELPPSERD